MKRLPIRFPPMRPIPERENSPFKKRPPCEAAFLVPDQAFRSPFRPAIAAPIASSFMLAEGDARSGLPGILMNRHTDGRYSYVSCTCQQTLLVHTTTAEALSVDNPTMPAPRACGTIGRLEDGALRRRMVSECSNVCLSPAVPKAPLCQCGEAMEIAAIETLPEGSDAAVRFYRCNGCQREMRLTVWATLPLPCSGTGSSCAQVLALS